MPKKIPGDLPKKSKGQTDSAYIDEVFARLYGTKQKRVKGTKDGVHSST